MREKKNKKQNIVFLFIQVQSNISTMKYKLNSEKNLSSIDNKQNIKIKQARAVVE